MINIDIFHDLIIKNRMKRRIDFIYVYLQQKLVDKIYNKVYRQHLRDYDFAERKPKLNKFIVECINIIWCILPCKYKIYPETFLMGNTIYNPDIHKRVNNGDIVRACVFPALRKHDESVTDIYVFCE